MGGKELLLGHRRLKKLRTRSVAAGRKKKKCRDGFEKLYASSSRVRVMGLRVRVESSLGLRVQVESRQCELAKKK